MNLIRTRNRLALLAVLLAWSIAPSTAIAQSSSAADRAAEIEAEIEAEVQAEESAASTTKTAGIESRVVLAGESDAIGDFESSDSVTGFSAADLDALGAQSVADLGKFTPNLEIVTTGSTTPTFFIRGVGLNDFNANSAGAVAIYTDDVPKNSPALQLGTLFDVEGVNILRGPQGTGPARNASAGAIKIYSGKPTGNYSSSLSGSYGRFDYLDVQGHIEAPLFEDILSGRVAFRFTEREGFVTNDCGGGDIDRTEGSENQLVGGGPRVTPPYSICGETVYRKGLLIFEKEEGDFVPQDGFTEVPNGLPSKVNDLGNWATRLTLRFQPTLDMDWLVGFSYGKRDEDSRLGQAYGTRGFFCDPDKGTEEEFVECLDSLPAIPGRPTSELRSLGRLGGRDFAGYQKASVIEEYNEYLEEARTEICGKPEGCPADPVNFPDQVLFQENLAQNTAKLELADSLVNLDNEPYRGAYNRVGPTQNEVWGTYLKGDIVLPNGFEFTTVTGYDAYDRLIDIDLDFTPNRTLQTITDDEGWQVTQDLRLNGFFHEDVPLRWDIGGFFLREELEVGIENDFGAISGLAGVPEREYTQTLNSAAGYASLAWDFLDKFTLDGGFRYNWEEKEMDYALFLGTSFYKFLQPPAAPLTSKTKKTWDAPTGGVRLTYRFREDTHVYWKYMRGWKGGHFNATASDIRLVTAAEPEEIDSFEAGIRGSWFEGVVNLDLSFFYYGYNDYQMFTVENRPLRPPELVVINANNVEIYGSEIDLKLINPPLWKWRGLFVNVRASWIESQFLDFSQTQVEEGNAVFDEFGTPRFETFDIVVNNTGNRVLNSPQFKVSITVEQTLPLGKWGSLVPRYDGAWTDVTYFDASEGRGAPDRLNNKFLPEETIAQSAYWLHNVRLAYRFPSGRVEIAGFVRNVDDKAYKNFAFDASKFNQTTINFIGDPRTYGGSLSMSF